MRQALCGHFFFKYYFLNSDFKKDVIAYNNIFLVFQINRYYYNKNAIIVEMYSVFQQKCIMVIITVFLQNFLQNIWTSTALNL